MKNKHEPEALEKFFQEIIKLVKKPNTLPTKGLKPFNFCQVIFPQDVINALNKVDENWWRN